MTRSTLAILFTFAAGALVGVVIGFTVMISTTNEARLSDPMIFPHWLQYPIGLAWWPWPIICGAIAVLIYLVIRLSRLHSF